MNFLCEKIKYSYFLREFTDHVLTFRGIRNILKITNGICARIKISSWNRSLPTMLHIENTNYCNARCSMCPYEIMKRKKGVMSVNLFKKIILEYQCFGGKVINLHGLGEPFLDETIFEKIKLAKNLGLHVLTSTNGSLLENTIFKKIIESGLDQLFISIDGFLPTTYSQIRKGLNYEKVKENVLQLSTYRREKDLKKPEVILRCLSLQENAGEVRLFYQFWKKYLDKILVTHAHNWGQTVLLKQDNLHSAENDVPCCLLWQQLFVHWDGTVCACCHDFDGKLIVGDANVEHIKNIWLGNKLNTLRRIHACGKKRTIDYCRQCQVTKFWF